jgi:hypothetical protein
MGLKKNVISDVPQQGKAAIVYGIETKLLPILVKLLQVLT